MKKYYSYNIAGTDKIAYKITRDKRDEKTHSWSGEFCYKDKNRKWVSSHYFTQSPYLVAENLNLIINRTILINPDSKSTNELCEDSWIALDETTALLLKNDATGYIIESGNIESIIYIVNDYYLGIVSENSRQIYAIYENKIYSDFYIEPNFFGLDGDLDNYNEIIDFLNSNIVKNESMSTSESSSKDVKAKKEKRAKNDRQIEENQIELPGILAEFRNALRDEIAKIEEAGQSSTIIKNGRKIQGKVGSFCYAFTVEYLPSLPADTPCKLVIEKNTYNVTVVSFDESEIVISSSVELPPIIAYARLENGSAILMEHLIKRIESNFGKENFIGNKMLPVDGSIKPFAPIGNITEPVFSSSLTKSQKEAISSAISNDITYIWGPPGTGKTTVIGDIIWNLYSSNRSVLIVSHTNTAVDGAIKKAVCKRDESGNIIENSILLKDDRSCPILRIGNSQSVLPDEVGIDYHTKLLGEDLFARQAALTEEQHQKSSELQKLLDIINKFDWINNSQLLVLEKTSEEISRISVKIDEESEKYGIADSERTQYLKKNPEIQKYKEYILQKEDLQRKKDNEEVLIDHLESKISDNLEILHNAKDELTKHKIYANLKEQINNSMSEEFLQAKINECEQGLFSLKNNYNVLTERNSELAKNIARATRNSITTLFSQKTVEEFQSEMQKNANIANEIYNEGIPVLQKTKQTYEQQLVEVKSLIQQMSDIKPTSTEVYWSRLVNETEKKISDDKESQELAKNAWAKIVESLDTLNKKIDSISSKADEYETMCANCEEIHKQITVFTENRNEKEAYVKKLISNEVNLANVAIGNDIKIPSDMFEQISTLKRLFNEISEELSENNYDETKQGIEKIRGELKTILCELDDIAEKIANLEKEAINRAEIVGATLAKSYLSDALQERKFDTVIIDEASMAAIPALWCASYIAEKSIIIVGDFLQLPPIAMADTELVERWLKTDVFEVSGVKAELRKKTRPSNLVMLNEQFRMESEIAEIANLYYGDYGGLISQDNLQSRIKKRNEFYKWFPEKGNRRSVEIIDTSEMHAWVTSVPQGKNHSRLNCFSAALTVEMAFKYINGYYSSVGEKSIGVGSPKVLIVAPYKPHVDRIKQLIDLAYQNYGIPKESGLVKAGTIHSFQGNEADIVIFDLVVDEPHWKANLFLPDQRDNENLRRLFNVAITRAIFKLFIVGNIEYCRKRAKNNALSQLLDNLIDVRKLDFVDANKLFPTLFVSARNTVTFEEYDTSKLLLCQEGDFFNFFKADIKKCKERIVIFSPFITANRLSELLPDMHDTIMQGKRVIVITKALSDRSSKDIASYTKYVDELRKIGVEVVYKKGMHEKIVIIDDSVMWMGSLNALSNNGNTGEIMMRHNDTRITQETEKIYNITNVEEAINTEYELKCPLCSATMVLGEASKGGLYWSCSECNYSRSMEQQYPVDGKLRCSCGGDYHFYMKNQPRWVCDLDSKHYQIMRRGDLRLEKMAALIPTKKDRRAVDKYFEDNSIRNGQSESDKKNHGISKNDSDIDGQINLFDMGMV